MSTNNTHKLKAYLLRKLRSKHKTQMNFTTLIRNYYRKSKQFIRKKKHVTNKLHK